MKTENDLEIKILSNRFSSYWFLEYSKDSLSSLDLNFWKIFKFYEFSPLNSALTLFEFITNYNFSIYRISILLIYFTFYYIISLIF